jgi:para-nitrobenzyl esterase
MKEHNEPKRVALGRRGLLWGGAAFAGGAIAASVWPQTRASASPKAAAPSMVSTTVSASAKQNIVETDCGKVFGFVRNGIITFKGIPYAASTAGANRFMPPAKAEPWTGVRSALYWGPVSPQAFTNTFDGRRGGWNHDDEAFMFDWEDGQPSDSCLVVNVWTPSINDNKKRPVMVWIHGGQFSSGSDNELRMYDGESLSRRGDLVMVSLNHRLGALGYLNLSEYGDKWASAANVGMLDIVAALQWVKANISNFGGDPNRVMIFGQSGGGGKVSTLMGMPAAEGLFHRAAIQSGSMVTMPPDRSGELAAAVVAELGLGKDTIDKIQELSSEAIVEAGLRAQRKLQRGPAGIPGMPGGAVNWGPFVDGKILPRAPWSPAGPSQSAQVPLLVGSVLNEFTNSIQMGDASLDSMSADEVKKRLEPLYGERTDALFELFQKNHPQATPFELFSRINSASSARHNAVTQAERKAALGAAPAYVYWFQWQTPVLDGRPRAYHCSELPFVFYNTDRCASMTGGGDEARALGATIADAWINFARKGDPNHPGLPQWPAFTAEKTPTMIFDTQSVMKNDPDGDERRAAARS